MYVFNTFNNSFFRQSVKHLDLTAVFTMFYNFSFYWHILCLQKSKQVKEGNMANTIIRIKKAEKPKVQPSDIFEAKNSERRENRKITQNITNWVVELREKKEAFHRQNSFLNS